MIQYKVTNTTRNGDITIKKITVTMEGTEYKFREKASAEIRTIAPDFEVVKGAEGSSVLNNNGKMLWLSIVNEDGTLRIEETPMTEEEVKAYKVADMCSRL